MKHNFLKILKSKAFYIVAALLVQVGILLMLMGYFSSRFLPVYYFMILLSFMMCFHIINRDSDSSSKLLWVLIIMALPIFWRHDLSAFWRQKNPESLDGQRPAGVFRL
jgi:cardiolipin synthase